MIDLLATFIVFFAVIDPIGTVPIYLAVTRGYGPREKRKIALIATLVSALVLLFFVVAGELILTAMEIPLSAFQISGGIVLFLFALSMVFGESKPEEEEKLVEKWNETAIFPLAIPSIAGPGAMLAAVLQTENARYSFEQQAQTVGMMMAVLLVTLVLMLGASLVHRVIGQAGASVISRVMGIILSAVAADSTLQGLQKYFSLQGGA